jgi:hypothetical protein
MSHTADLRVEILDLEALKAACEPLGLEFRENQKTHKSYYRSEICEHAIAVKNKPEAFEVGVVKSPIGRGWTLRADPWNGGNGLMDAIGGPAANKIRQEYSLQVAAKKIPRGFRMQRVLQANGHVQLRCTR